MQSYIKYCITTVCVLHFRSFSQFFPCFFLQSNIIMYVQSFILWTWLAQRERTELATLVTELKVRRMCLEIKLLSWSVAGLKHRESLLQIKCCNHFGKAHPSGCRFYTMLLAQTSGKLENAFLWLH